MSLCGILVFEVVEPGDSMFSLQEYCSSFHLIFLHPSWHCLRERPKWGTATNFLEEPMQVQLILEMKNVVGYQALCVLSNRPTAVNSKAPMSAKPLERAENKIKSAVNLHFVRSKPKR